MPLWLLFASVAVSPIAAKVVTAPDCSEACAAALQEERAGRMAERERYLSELATLRTQLESERRMNREMRLSAGVRAQRMRQ